MKAQAVPTPALRHAAAKQCEAFDMRSAQAGLQVSLCDELRRAALHAARLGSLAWVGAYMPLLKHGDISYALWRHAMCQCTGVRMRGACYAALELVRRTAKASVVACSGYSTVLGRLRHQCPATLELVSQ